MKTHQRILSVLSQIEEAQKYTVCERNPRQLNEFTQYDWIFIVWQLNPKRYYVQSSMWLGDFPQAVADQIPILYNEQYDAKAVRSNRG